MYISCTVTKTLIEHTVVNIIKANPFCLTFGGSYAYVGTEASRVQ